MAEPFVFSFAPGPGGHPEAMYIADLWCACGVCGHPQIQRFYHSTPLHPLTFEQLSALARSLHERADSTCENCDTVLGARDVASTVLRYAFADDAGELVCFTDELGSVDGPRQRWQILRHRRLDPQVQPSQHPDEAHDLLEEIDEDLIQQRVDRAFSVKLAWRSLLAEWRADPEGGAWTQVSPDCFLALETSEDAMEALLDELYDREDLSGDDWYELPLIESSPDGLPTHEDTERISGHWRGWLPEEITRQLEEGDLIAVALIHPEHARQVITRAFEVARLEFEQGEDDDGEQMYSHITTPRESAYPGELFLSDVLARAAYTGITPGEAARLTAEEIVGVLLRVWKV
jgi:hypothetical protein